MKLEWRNIYFWFFLISSGFFYLINQGVSQNHWEDHFLPLTVPRYEVAMRFYWKIDHDLDYITCPGVILNDRYVLTHTKCTFRIRQNFKELEYIYHSYGGIFFNDSSFSEVFSESFHIDEFWSYGPITLVRRVNPFIFNATYAVRCIKLPGPQELTLWENPHDLPNNIEITSSRWCGKFAHYLQYQIFLKGIRNCTNSVIRKTSKMLIPSCLTSKSSPLLCEQLQGNPLVLNDFLIGIRNHEGLMPPSPETKIQDLYLNLIPYVPVIKSYMQNYKEC